MSASMRTGGSVRAGFVERFGLWSAEQQGAAREVAARVDADGLEVIRFSFPDQHGVLRGKTIVAGQLGNALANGVGITSTMYAKDTSGKTVFPVFSAGGGFDMPEMQGAADVLMVADPTTFTVLPWAQSTGWMLCDTYFGSGRDTGEPVPFDTRNLLRGVLGQARDAGFDYVTGLEVEFHVYRLASAALTDANLGLPGAPGAPPAVVPLTQGYQYLTEQRFDQLEPVLELLRRDLLALGLPLRSLECEFGPSQAELTFSEQAGLANADAMVLLRSAVKQICRRHGFHATFMCRPGLPNAMASGWHLHQSLRPVGSDLNAFTAGEGAHGFGGDAAHAPRADGAPLSPVGMAFLGGLLEHARGATALSTPTINGYRRYRPHSLAPDRAIWARDNRGAMLRVLGGPGDPGSRIENRAGESAANPYLYMSGQLLAGLDGLARGVAAGPSADAPYESAATPLPRSLPEALEALAADDVLSAGLGRRFVDYYCRIKRAELERFDAEVSAWEQREYFELF